VHWWLGEQRCSVVPPLRLFYYKQAVLFCEENMVPLLSMKQNISSVLMAG